MSRKARSGAGSRADTSKRSNKEVRREQLLEASLVLFARRDFATVTNKDIATAAGMNSALIYYYFESKEHLFRSALEFGVLRLLEEYRAIHDSSKDPVQRIRHWFRINVEMSETIRQVIKIMIDYNATVDTEFSIDDLIEHFYKEEERGILASSIRDGIGLGLFRPVNVASTARFVSVHLDGIMAANLARGKLDIKGALRDLEKFLWWHLGYDPKASRRLQA